MCRSHPLLVANSMAPGRLLTYWGMVRLVVRALVYLGLAVVKKVYDRLP